MRFPRNGGNLIVGNVSGGVSNPTALTHDTYLSWDRAAGGAFRVHPFDSGENPVDVDFTVQLF